MKIEGSTIEFSSGRTAYANQGIIGLEPKKPGQGWLILGGYDGMLAVFPDPFPEDRDCELTTDDLKELADYMIDQWTQFKAALT